MEDFNNYISKDKNIRFGKPCVTGTRIAVEEVLGWLESGLDFEAIKKDFPELNETQIRAWLEYARQT